MVGYNFDGGGSKRMTTDEREATRALGGIALLGGIGYLYLTSKAPARPVKALTLFSAGAFQERGSGFVIQNVDVKNPAKQTLVGFDWMPLLSKCALLWLKSYESLWLNFDKQYQQWTRPFQHLLDHLRQRQNLKTFDVFEDLIHVQLFQMKEECFL